MRITQPIGLKRDTS